MGKSFISKRKRKYYIKKHQKEINNRFIFSKYLKRELFLTVVSIVGVTLVMLGSSFAVFSTTIKADDYNVLKTGTLVIEFDDTTNGLGNIISLNNAYPVSDETGMNSTPYNFELKNTGTVYSNYIVKIIDDEDMIKEDNCENNLLDKSFIKYSIDKSNPKVLKETKDFIVMSNQLKDKESITHSIRMWISNDAGNEVLGKHYHGKIVVEAIQSETPAIDRLLQKANSIELSYNNSTKLEKQQMYPFVNNREIQQEEFTDEELIDYRYIGNNPYNYINFNDEIWRIIGVFTALDEAGLKSKKIKIIRNEALNYLFQWSNQYNEWSTSSLTDLLNKGDYYNKKGSYSDFGLDEKSKKQISSVKYYLGNIDEKKSISGVDLYTLEKSDNLKESTETYWLGKVSLMYASDYIYTYGKDFDNTCFNTFNNCINKSSWLNIGKKEWLLNSSFNNFNNALVIDENGNINYNNKLNEFNSVRPVVYLKSNLSITKGDGSKDNPYVLN